MVTFNLSTKLKHSSYCYLLCCHYSTVLPASTQLFVSANLWHHLRLFREDFQIFPAGTTHFTGILERSTAVLLTYKNMIRIRWRIQKILHWKWDRAVSNFFEALYKILFGRLYFITLNRGGLQLLKTLLWWLLWMFWVNLACTFPVLSCLPKGGLHFISECQQSAITWIQTLFYTFRKGLLLTFITHTHAHTYNYTLLKLYLTMTM